MRKKVRLLLAEDLLEVHPDDGKIRLYTTVLPHERVLDEFCAFIRDRDSLTEDDQQEILGRLD